MGGGASKQEPTPPPTANNNNNKTPQQPTTPPPAKTRRPPSSNALQPRPPGEGSPNNHRPLSTGKSPQTTNLPPPRNPEDDNDYYGLMEDQTHHPSSSNKPMMLTRNNTSTKMLGRTGVASNQRETALGISTASSVRTNNSNASPNTTSISPGGGSPNTEDLYDMTSELNRTNSKAASAFASTKVRAKAAEKENHDKLVAQRQATTNNLLGGTLTIGAGATAFGQTLGGNTMIPGATTTALSAANILNSAKEARQVVNGTAKIKNLCETMNKFRAQLKKHTEVSDSDIAEMKRTQEQYAQLKSAMAQQIASIGEHVDIVGKPNRQLLYDLLEGIMMEGEVREGTSQLLYACVRHLTPLDWQVDFVVGGKKMLSRCATEGWFAFLDILLDIGNLVVASKDEAEMLMKEEEEILLTALSGKTAGSGATTTKSVATTDGKQGDGDDDDDFLAGVEDDADPFQDVGKFVQDDDSNIMADSVTSLNKSVTSAARNLKTSSPSPSASPTSPSNLDHKIQSQRNQQLQNYLDPVELLELCNENYRFRIPLVGALCKHWSKLRFVEYSRDMAPVWNKIVKSLCSASKTYRGEDRTQRIGLLTKILSLSTCIPININKPETEGPDADNNSFISRAIAEGETAVFQTLTKKSSNVDWTIILPDGHSLLTLACVCAQKTIVEILLAQPLTDINYEAPGHGTALEIVKIEGGGNQQITALIEGKLKKIADEKEAAEKSRVEKDRKSHMQEIKKKTMERKRKVQELARKAQPPKFIEENPPTGPKGVNPEKDADWVYGFHLKEDESKRPVVLTGPILEIVNALKEHWNLLDSMTHKQTTTTKPETPPTQLPAPEIEVIKDAGDEDDLSDIDDGEEKKTALQNKKSSFLSKKSSFLSNNSRKSSFVSATTDENNKRKDSHVSSSSNKDTNNVTPSAEAENNTNNSEPKTEVQAQATVEGDFEQGTIAISMAVRKEIVIEEEEEEETPKPQKEDSLELSAIEQPPELIEALAATAKITSRLEDNEYLLDGEALRRDLISTVMTFGNRILVEGKDPKEKVYRAVDRLLSESRTVKGSLKLARILMFRVITVDFAPSIAGNNKWALKAAKVHDIEALETLLRVDKLWREEHEVVELVMACTRSKEKRFELCLIILRHQKALRMGTYRDHLRPLWEELIESTTNPSKINFTRLTEHEKKLRFELFCRLFSNPGFFQIRHDTEIAPGITYFSRACKLGDIEFVRACLLYVVCDINKVYSNKSTPLMQAVVGNQLEVVKMLCECPDLDPFIEGPNDSTAIELAKQVNRGQDMIDVLIKVGEEFSRKLLGTPAAAPEK